MSLRRCWSAALVALLGCSSASAPGPTGPAADPRASDAPSAGPPAEADSPGPAPGGDPAPGPASGTEVGPAEAEGQPEYQVEEITKIPECDEYLALYRFCEPRLEAEIMAGDRRTYRAERASLEYFLTTPEAAAMPETCAEMLRALETDCLER